VKDKEIQSGRMRNENGEWRHGIGKIPPIELEK
jgi:hypothetical protein